MINTLTRRTHLPEWVVTEPELHEALDNFADTFDEEILAGVIASQLTCSEVEALAGLLATAGALGAARLWLGYHADGDRSDYDSHYGLDEHTVEVSPPRWLAGRFWEGREAVKHRPRVRRALDNLLRSLPWARLRM